MDKPTIKDIARMADVSIGTVSNVINGKGRYSVETKKKIDKIIKELNFMPNAAARSLKDKLNPLIALVVPFADKGEVFVNPFFTQLISGVESGARDRNFHVIVAAVKDEPQLSVLLEKQINGLIVFGANENQIILEEIKKLRLPTVFMDSYLSDPELYQLVIDDELGGYLATKHLISLGHKSINVIAGNLEPIGNSADKTKMNTVGHLRLFGHLKALEEAGIEFDPSLVFPHEFSVEDGYSAAQQIIKQKGNSTAVFAFSDMTAMGVIKGFYDLGVSVPNDFSVVGFDDLYFSEYLTPGLTTVRQDIYGRGHSAVKLLIDQIEEKNMEHNRKLISPVSLKIRQSTVSLNS